MGKNIGDPEQVRKGVHTGAKIQKKKTAVHVRGIH